MSASGISTVSGRKATPNRVPKVIVLGGEFRGLTAGICSQRSLGSGVDVTVVARQKDFVFIPVADLGRAGKRSKKQVAFDLKPHLEAKGIRFLEARADSIDPKAKAIETDHGPARVRLPRARHWPEKLDGMPGFPGLVPRTATHSVAPCPMDEAGEACLREFLKDPGPIVVGAAQGASCFGPP